MKQKGLLGRTSEETRNKVIKMYQQGFSQSHLERTLRMTRKTIRTILENEGIKRSRQEQTIHHHITSTLREDAFDVVTDQSAYWLGFLYADGYITNPEHTTALGILLKESDIGHLEKFKEFMKAPQVIYHNEKYKNVKIKIGSQRLHRTLIERWGFTNRKSYDAKPPEFLKYNRHFWRGVIDGDGYIGFKKSDDSAVLQLCGTEAMVSGFRDFLVNSGVDSDAKVAKSKGKELWTFCVAAGLAEGALRILYEHASIYLDRKYGKYLSILTEEEQDEESLNNPDYRTWFEHWKEKKDIVRRQEDMSSDFSPN